MTSNTPSRCCIKHRADISAQNKSGKMPSSAERDCMRTVGFFCSLLSCEFFCNYSKLLHLSFNCKYLQAVLWQPYNAQQEVKSQVSGKRHILGQCKGDNHCRYGEDIMAEGPTMGTLAGLVLSCSRDRGIGFGVMLPEKDRFISKRQTTGTAFCMMPGDNSSPWCGVGQDCAVSDSLGRLFCHLQHPHAGMGCPWHRVMVVRKQGWGCAAFLLLLKQHLQPGFEVSRVLPPAFFGVAQHPPQLTAWGSQAPLGAVTHGLGPSSFRLSLFTVFLPKSC